MIEVSVGRSIVGLIIEGVSLVPKKGKDEVRIFKLLTFCRNNSIKKKVPNLWKKEKETNLMRAGRWFSIPGRFLRLPSRSEWRFLREKACGIDLYVNCLNYYIICHLRIGNIFNT